MAATNAGFAALLTHTTPPAGLLNQVRIPAPADGMYEGLKGLIFARLYHAKDYSFISQMMYFLLTQNFTAIDETDAALAVAAASTTSAVYNLGAAHSFWGITCSEASYRAESPDDMYELVQKQEAVSGFVDAFIGSVWPCVQRKMKAAESFAGPFKAKTNFPIMFVNGEYDPATPISSARKAAENFEGSVLLTHGGQGYKFFRHPSQCTSDAVRNYFVNGVLPEPGTYCAADVNAFEVVGEGAAGVGMPASTGGD